MTRYGCRWPDGSETGPITDHQRLAASYARDHGGTVVVYEVNEEES